LIRTRSDKQEAGPTYTGTFGFHPLLAMIAETGEVLTGKIRPGNAGANNAEDHVVVLNAAIGQLPPEWQTGHNPGNSPETVEKQLVARSDGAGASHWFVEECRHRNIGYTIGYQVDHRVRAAVYWTKEDTWDPAIEPNGRLRVGAEITELTDRVDMTTWPTGTRLIVRREDPHPGAQLSLFDTIEGKRHTAFITDSPGEPAELELRHRQRGRAESVIRDVKACGMTKFPFDDVVNNSTWLHLCFAANDLLAWGRAISLTGTLRKATPKTIRYRILHVAARTSPGHQHLRLDQTWPWTTQITDAITTIHQRLQPPTVTATRGIHPGL
jgi:Transposase DDE domain group 1